MKHNFFEYYFSGLFAAALADMGYSTLLVLTFVAAIHASPYGDFRSNLEVFQRDTNLDEPAYRLKNNVQPSYINVDLDVYLDESRFNGLVQIEVDVLESDMAQIVLHQNVVSILAVSVLDNSSQPIPLQFPNPFETDDYYEILKINFASPISSGAYTIIVSYAGKINENPVDRGFYKGYYYYNNQKRYYATTQFQPFHARKAFPCFDEPQFKSRFVISITRDSELSPSYSNMAISQTQSVTAGRVRETFLPTPVISAYLIAFHVSDFNETTSTSTDEKPFKIISRQGVTDQHAYAADIGLKITNELSEYLAVEYYNMGQDVPMKNDHIALPDFPSGAMENWGMVNYREAYLLYDELNTNLPSKISIATIMAHELGHKWFGNLVTCFWWSNLWLNESFASFFEYFGAHMADPTLELDDQFVVDYVHSALSSDASSGATPMNWTGVITNPSISAHFSTTSYAKGASVLKMIEHFVGPTNFRNALRLYLKENAYSLGTPEALYNAFRTVVAQDPTFAQLYPGIDIGDVIDSWVQTPGAPILDVQINTTTGAITITQERFQLSGTPHTLLWQIPVTWTWEADPDFLNTKPLSVLTQKTTVGYKRAGEEWVIFNNKQSGYYRVNYDEANWRKIAVVLRENRTLVHKLNRAQIVNDVLFFIRAGKIEIELAFDILSFLIHETDYYVWSGALGQLDWIRKRLEHLPAAYEEFNNYLLENMEKVIEELGFEDRQGDSISTILNRLQIMNYVCLNMNHQACYDYSVNRWKQYRENENNLVPVNARRYVYCNGLRAGDASDYRFLYQKYNSSENTADMVVILRTLGCTKDKASLEDYLEQTMYNDKIRIHDKPNAFQYALLGNPDNLDTVLDFVYKNYQEIPRFYGGVDRFNTALGSLSGYLTDFQKITAFQSWLYQNQLSLSSSFSTGVSVINTSVNNLQWGNDIAVDLYSVLKSRNSAASIMTPFTLILAAIVAQLLK